MDPRAEDGLVLVMVLGILIFFSITVVTAITMSSSTQSTANVSSSGQDSYALAETGINDALGVVENVPANDPTNANLLGSSSSPNVTTTSTGSVSWYGTYDSTNRIWTITSTSSVASPVSGGPTLHNTLTRQISISPSLNGNWDRIYADDTTQCLTVPDGVNIPSNLSAHGNLCLVGSTVTGANTIVSAGGTTTLTPAPQSATDTGSVNTRTGTGWTNPAGILTAGDNSWATYNFPANAVNAVSTSLTATNFGFAIPAGSTINGIEVHVIHKGNNKNKINDQTFQLMKAGVPGGTNEAAGGWDNPNNGQNQKYGGPADLWGTTWTPADINNANFGTYLVATNTTTAAQIASIDDVYVIVTYTPPADDASIGLNGSPVKEADLTGTCNYNAQGAHTPCSPTDHVWANKVTTAPAMSKPPVDFNYWYNNAAPGPKHPCTVHTGTPPIFDNNGVYDNSDAKQPIAPGNANGATSPDLSYTCISKDANGNVLGQLSWNMITQVLTISGTIFIDGEADFDWHHYVVHYQGRGAIYAPGGSHIDSQVCAGGSGATSCVTTGMSNWDPSQNLLVMVVGDKESAGNNDCKIDESDSAFQGVYWSKNTCDISKAGAQISGPIIANDLSIASGTVFNPWPNLGTILPGVNAGAAVYTFTLGNQSG